MSRTTEGICCSCNPPSQMRFFLFELDGAMSEIKHDIEKVVAAYVQNNLDMLMHKTGNGYHFLSPTLISRGLWSTMMKELRPLNPKCPMTTLRWLPNKHPNEREIWTIAKAHYAVGTMTKNSNSFCNLLNKVFGTSFVGGRPESPKRVLYPIE